MKRLIALAILLFIYQQSEGRDLHAKDYSADSTGKATAKRKPVRQLRYIFSSNGGLIGFFSDGTVAACPRCDYCTTNINYLKKEKPHAKYKVSDEGLIIVGKDGSEDVMPFETESPMERWPLVNYEWKDKPGKCE